VSVTIAHCCLCATKPTDPREPATRSRETGRVAAMSVTSGEQREREHRVGPAGGRRRGRRGA
jgi:hypothetical protein